MKKILSLGAAAAVLSLTAVAASAAITPKFSTDAPVAGETVTVEIVAEGMTQEATTFTVAASENLSLVSAEAVAGGLFSDATNKFAWAGTAVPADGTVLLTLTYTVNAAADEEVSVTLTPDAGFTDIDAAPVALVVVDGNTDVPPETVEPTTEDVEPTTDEGGLTDTADTSETEPTDEGGEDNGNTDNKGNPITGVGLAVVPAVLAGAAIVVAKKRK